MSLALQYNGKAFRSYKHSPSLAGMLSNQYLSAAPTMCLPEKEPKNVLVTSVFETLETEIMHSVPRSNIVLVLHGRHCLDQSILDSSVGASFLP